MASRPQRPASSSRDHLHPYHVLGTESRWTLPLPPELIHEIIYHLYPAASASSSFPPPLIQLGPTDSPSGAGGSNDVGLEGLKSLKLASKSLLPICRHAQFHKMTLRNGQRGGPKDFHKFATLLQHTPIISTYVEQLHFIDAGGTFLNSRFKTWEDHVGFLGVLNAVCGYGRLKVVSLRLGLIWFRVDEEVRRAFQGWVGRTGSIESLSVSFIGLGGGFFAPFATRGLEGLDRGDDKARPKGKLDELEISFENAFQAGFANPEQECTAKDKLSVRALKIMKRVPANPSGSTIFSLGRDVDFSALEEVYLGIPAFVLSRVSTAFPVIGGTVKKLTFDLFSPPMGPDDDLLTNRSEVVHLDTFPQLKELNVLCSLRYGRYERNLAATRSFLNAVLPKLLHCVAISLPSLEVLRLTFGAELLDFKVDMDLLHSIGTSLHPSLDTFECGFIPWPDNPLPGGLLPDLLRVNSFPGMKPKIRFFEASASDCGSVWMH